MESHELLHSHEHMHDHLHLPPHPEITRRQLIRGMLGLTTTIVLGSCGNPDNTQQLTTVPSDTNDIFSGQGATVNEKALRLDNQEQLRPTVPPIYTRAWNPGDYIIGGDPNYPFISFSFDDVPSHTVARQIMNAFENAGLHGKTAFFVVGSIVYVYEDVLREMVDRGFEIMNHSMTHGYDISKNIQEIDPMNQLIESFTGYKPTLYRGPGGGVNDTMLQFLAQRNMAFLWTGSNMNDWTSPRINAQQIINNFRPAAVAGSHILLHGSNTHQQTALAVPELIRISHENGLEVLSPSEHMSIGNLERRSLQIRRTEAEITESFEQSGLITDRNKLEAEWIIELQTVLEESTHLSEEKRQFIENEIKGREALLESNQ